jgi:hypothetical protein
MSPKRTYEKNFRRIKKLDQTNKFTGCKQLADLRKLPLTDYSNYQKEFTRSLQTKVNPFNGEKVFFWATSTGSSGEPKIFPITRSTKKEQTHISKFRPAQLIKKFSIYGGDRPRDHRAVHLERAPRVVRDLVDHLVDVHVLEDALGRACADHVERGPGQHGPEHDLGGERERHKIVILRCRSSAFPARRGHRA